MAQADTDFDWTTAVAVEDESSSTLAATPFGARTQPQPTQGPVVYDDEFDWKTATLEEPFDVSTAQPLSAQEEHAFYKDLDQASRDPARILTNTEHSLLYDWRQQQDDAVSRFFEGASDIPGNLAQIAVDATKETAQNYAENYALNRARFYKRNIATGAEVGRKVGVQLLQLFDWGQNKASDIAQRGRANDAKMREIAAQIPKTGDPRVDGDNVVAAIAKARDEGVFEETAFGPGKEEDYDRYLRQNSYNRSHAGNITEATMGGQTMTFPEEQMTFMGEKPMQSVATGGAMIFDPINALPLGAGVFSKLRILRRLSRATGMPLPAVERGLAATADGMESLGARVAAGVTEKTGLSKTQQVATASAVGGGAVLLAATTEGMDGVLLPVAALAGVPALYKAVGGTIRKTSQAAGVGAEVVREMRAGNIGSMRQASAEDLLRTGAVPKPYADFMQPYATGVESTLGRMAKNPNNAEITRKLSRLADNTGVTQAFRFTDDAVSSGVAATLASTPFALLAPDAEQAGAIVGGAATLGTFAGPVTGAFVRRQGAVNADIARMLIDAHAVNGDVPALLSLGRDRLGQIAGMQGVLAGKTDFVTLRASDYRANVDMRNAGAETLAGVFIEKASDGTARVFINLGEPVSMDGKVRVRDRGDGVREVRVRGADGRTEFIAAPKNRRVLVNDGDTVKAGQQVVDYMPASRSIPHEIAHAILTSDILDGDIRTDMQNYVTQVYGEDGIQARGQEYIGKIVDGDIMFGTHEGQVILTPEEAADVRSGKRTMSDVMKGKPVEAAERDALIAARIDEYNQRSRENGGNDWDWARNEVIAEQFAGESQGIDFRSIRRGGPKLMESALATSARVLEALGAKFDRTTGKPLDNPSVLFRDNPLFQSPVLRKRMIEHVRAYNDLLTGLEEAGKREARGTKVSVDGTPESAARSPHMKQRADQDQGGRVGNEFLYTDENGKTQWRSPSEVRGRENARTSQAKTLYNPSRIVSPTSTEFGLRRTDSGRTIIGGPTLPAQFDHFVHFPKWFREFARTLEASRERGGTFIADYNAIGDGKDGTYRVRNRGDIRAILREVAFVGWEMTRNNHLKTVLVDLNAFRGATMRAINNGELGIFNNDMSVIEADLRAYLDNHKNGRPGETGIGQAKRDMLNGLIGTGTAVQRKANPLYSDLNPRGSVRSFRLDRFNDLTPTGREGLPFDYDKINSNRMPNALPQAGMAMPDVAVVPERFTGTGQEPNRQSRFVNPPPFFARFPIESYERGGKFFDAQSGEDLTGRSYGAGFIDVSSGKPRLFVDGDPAAQPAKSGRTYRTNLFKQKAGWKWISDNAPATSTIVSVEGGGRHVYALRADFEGGVDLARYSDKPSEPRLRPTARGELSLGNEVGRISIRGKEHPVYDGARITQRDVPRGQAMPDAAVTQDGLVQAPEDAPTFKLPRRAMAQFMPDTGIRLEDYADRPIVALPADRMGIGQMRVGPRGREQILSVPGQGGAGFMEIYNGGGWAFTDTATADRFLGRLREVARPGENSVVVGITALNEVNHLKNQTGQLAYVEALEAAINSKAITKKQADAHIREISKRIYTSDASPKALTPSTRSKFKSMRGFDDFQKAVRAKQLNFADAAWLLKKMQQKALPLPYKDAQAIGIAFDDVARQTADPRYADVPFGTVVALLEVPINQAPSRNPFHYAYPAKVEGNRIGFLSKFQNIDDLTSDPRIRNKQGRVTAQPLQTVLPVMDRIGARGQAMPDVADIASSTSVGALQKHPMFKAAKYDGSAKAAFDIVESMVKPKAVKEVMDKIDPNRPAYIIPVIAREGESANMLPLAMAEKLSAETGIPVWMKLAKTSSQHNTGAGADSRARTMHRWEGEPPPAGSQIVLVDDTYTTGQTLRSLASVVGDPDAVATISVGRYTKQFTLQPDREQKLLAKAGLTKQQFINLYGSEPKQVLTGAQAQQYLLNGARGQDGLLARFPADRGGFSTQAIAGLTQLPEGVTTFSGGGLVEIGLRGIVRPTVAVEYSPAIAQAYRAAHGDHVKVQDIRTVSLEDHKGKFHYHASPVCKNSSLLKSAALGGGEKDLDIESAQAVARHIDQIEPKVVTIENVPDYAKTEAADIIRKKLQERGYTVDENVYNAAKFGAPTARRRYLLRAVKDGVLPEPVPQDGPGWYSTVADLIETLPDDSIARAQYIYRSLREQGVDPDNVTEPLLVSGTTLFKKVAFARPDQPAFTFKATPATVDRILLPGGRVKRVTARAKARMTGIPDDYPLPNDEKTALTIIGNGVPPALVRNVFGPVIEANK